MSRVERAGRIFMILAVATLALGIGSLVWADDDDPRPFLGVRLDPLEDGGARIVGIVEESAAERAGLREGDVIVSVDGETVTAADDLSERLRRSRPGERVELEIDRDGQTERITAELGEHPARGRWTHRFSLGSDELEQLEERLEGLHLQLDGLELQEMMEQLHEQLGERDLDFDFRFDPRGHCSGRPGGRPLLGVELVGVTPELREHLGANPDEGVLVGRVIPGTPAEEAGVEVGDLIIGLDGVMIDVYRTLRSELASKSGESIDLEVIREGRRMTLPVFIPEPAIDGDAKFERRRPAPAAAWPTSMSQT